MSRFTRVLYKSEVLQVFDAAFNFTSTSSQSEILYFIFHYIYLTALVILQINKHVALGSGSLRRQILQTEQSMD